MLSLFTPKAPKMPGMAGKDHEQQKTKYNPFSYNPGIQSFSATDMFSPGAKTPTDAGSQSNTLSRNRVWNKIVAKVGNKASDHFYKEYDILLIWNGLKTITSDQRSIYEIPTLAVLNNKIRELQLPKFHELIENKTSSSKFSVASSSPSSDKVNVMSLKTLYQLIDVLGLPLHEITAGTKPQIELARNVGGVSFTVNHEGRSEIGNLWDDNAAGSHVNFALKRPASINTSNPFEIRFHQLEPCTSRTSTGMPSYHRYGISCFDHRKRMRSIFHYEPRVTKQARTNSDKPFITSYGMITSSNSASSRASSVRRGKRYSFIIHCEELEMKTITGTVFSLMRHERVCAREEKKDQVCATKVNHTFLDWSVGQYDASKSLSSATSRLLQSKKVYNLKLYRIVRHQTAVYKFGVVLTSQRGGEPSKELQSAVVYHDHECQGENMQKLKTDHKITIHVRNQ